MTRNLDIYFAVPTHYTIGTPFESFAAAVEHARSTIKPFDGIPGESRAFVDVRLQDARGDRSIMRVEVFSDRVELIRGSSIAS